MLKLVKLQIPGLNNPGICRYIPSWRTYFMALRFPFLYMRFTQGESHILTAATPAIAPITPPIRMQLIAPILIFSPP